MSWDSEESRCFLALGGGALGEEDGFADAGSPWVGVGGVREQGGRDSCLLALFGECISVLDGAEEGARDASLEAGRGEAEAEAEAIERGESRSRLSDGPGERTCSLQQFVRYDTHE